MDKIIKTKLNNVLKPILEKYFTEKSKKQKIER